MRIVFDDSHIEARAIPDHVVLNVLHCDGEKLEAIFFCSFSKLLFIEFSLMFSVNIDQEIRRGLPVQDGRKARHA